VRAGAAHVEHEPQLTLSLPCWEVVQLAVQQILEPNPTFLTPFAAFPFSDSK
jgi:hypothetical protein